MTHEKAIVRNAVIEVVCPTRQDIETLAVGDFAPNCFNGGRVTEIFARKEDLKGRLFVCYYTAFGRGADSAISASLKEDEVLRNVSLCQYLNSGEIDSLESRLRQQRKAGQ